MVTTDVSHCFRCGGVIPPNAPLGLCRKCYQLSTGLPAAEWDAKTSHGGVSVPDPAAGDDPDAATRKDNRGSQAESIFKPNQRIGNRWVLLEQLGVGGMGEVWKADDPLLEQTVALKFLAPAIREDRRALDLLRREVKTLRKLTHRNILRIHEWHEKPDDPQEPVCMAMEFVEGGTLEDRLTMVPGGYFSWVDLRPLVKQLCEALFESHRSNIIHRDLKPRNVLVTWHNQVKLADFGLARASLRGTASSSRETRGAGTLAYMSPQQRLGHDPTIADDIYALGATLFELSTGQPPPSPHLGKEIDRKTWPRPPTVSEAIAGRGPCDVTSDVQRTIQACLAYDPENRPHSAYEVMAMLGLVTTSGGHGSVFHGGSTGSMPSGFGLDSTRMKILTGVLGVLVLALAINAVKGCRGPAPGSTTSPTNSLAKEATPAPGPMSRPSDSRLPEPEPMAHPPKIVVTLPLERKLTEGDGCLLEARVESDTSPVICQWYRDGQLLPGATRPGYEIGAVARLDEGLYVLVASSSAGATTGEVARLAVVPKPPQAPPQAPPVPAPPRHPPVITPILPLERKAVEGDRCVLEAQVQSEVTPVTCQWYRDGQLLSGATGRDYLIRAVSKSDEGSFTLVVRSAAGAATGEVARLTVGARPAPPVSPARKGPRAGQRWTNSLGIPFVPLPGTTILIAVWETRVSDYQQMLPGSGPARRTATDSLVADKTSGGSNHPVVNVSWTDAVACCAWLTRVEHEKGLLSSASPDQQYRLPTVSEWLSAAGFKDGGRWNGDAAPQDDASLMARLRQGQFALPTLMNVAGQERSEDPRTRHHRFLSTHRDASCFTAPVDTLGANLYGVCHLFGNVWEWCADAGEEPRQRWAMGGSYATWALTYRSWAQSVVEQKAESDLGFRMVLETTSPSGSR